MIKTAMTAIALVSGLGMAGAAIAEPGLFQQGLQDRAGWEQWFNSLQGDYKIGAFYWAGQRSLSHPGNCQQMDADFYRGCTDAKVKLATSDALRKTEPAYKAGWNSYTASAGLIAAPEMASTPAQAPQVTINVGTTASTQLAPPPPAAQPQVPAAVRPPAPTSGSDQATAARFIGLRPEIAGAVKADLGMEFAHCAAFYELGVQLGQRDWPNVQQSDGQRAYDMAMKMSVALTGQDITLANLKLGLDDMMRITARDVNRMPIVVAKYGPPCRDMLEHPMARMEYWINVETAGAAAAANR